MEVTVQQSGGDEQDVAWASRLIRQFFCLISCSLLFVSGLPEFPDLISFTHQSLLACGCNKSQNFVIEIYLEYLAGILRELYLAYFQIWN